MSEHYADHQPQSKGRVLKWPTLAAGPGRWAILHDLAGPAGLLYLTDSGAIGFKAFRATPIQVGFTMGVQQASNTEGSSPERVFDYWAASGSINRYAGPIHTTDNLGAVANWAAEHNSEPPADYQAQ